MWLKVANVAMETTQLVLSQFKNFLTYRRREGQCQSAIGCQSN